MSIKLEAISFSCHGTAFDWAGRNFDQKRVSLHSRQLRSSFSIRFTCDFIFVQFLWSSCHVKLKQFDRNSSSVHRTILVQFDLVDLNHCMFETKVMIKWRHEYSPTSIFYFLEVRSRWGRGVGELGRRIWHQWHDVGGELEQVPARFNGKPCSFLAYLWLENFLNGLLKQCADLKTCKMCEFAYIFFVQFCWNCNFLPNHVNCWFIRIGALDGGDVEVSLIDG